MSFRDRRRETHRIQNEDKKRKRAARKQQLRTALADHPLRLYRPSRVAALFDVDQTTVWRWKRDGILPPPIEIAGVSGWTHEQLATLLKSTEAE